MINREYKEIYLTGESREISLYNEKQGWTRHHGEEVWQHSEQGFLGVISAENGGFAFYSDNMAAPLTALWSHTKAELLLSIASAFYGRVYERAIMRKERRGVANPLHSTSLASLLIVAFIALAGCGGGAGSAGIPQAEPVVAITATAAQADEAPPSSSTVYSSVYPIPSNQVDWHQYKDLSAWENISKDIGGTTPATFLPIPNGAEKRRGPHTIHRQIQHYQRNHRRHGHTDKTARYEILIRVYTRRTMESRDAEQHRYQWQDV